jgi:radical SAM superfamily enzyme YgiQ (UPF0313 family)
MDGDGRIRLRVYLTELFHTFAEANRETSPYTVPLGIGYLAATIQHKLPTVEVRLFRDANELVEAIRRSPPDVLGFSVTNWNIDLSRRMAQYVKARLPRTVLVAGGPSVDDEDGPIVEFFDHFSTLDYLIPSEGELGIVALLTHLMNGGERSGVAVPGVAYRDAGGALVRGAYAMPTVSRFDKPSRARARAADSAGEELDEIPSPYLTGLLDPFLAQGLTPILQTMRGCPYRCDFCVSGTSLWNSLRGFELERVKAEIDHIMARSRTGDLLLTDENWGVLGERDIEIARHLVQRSRETNWPRRVYYYTAKIVTDAVREVVETIRPIAWNAEMAMSFQSLNPETRKAIRRTNISLDKLTQNVHWADERGIKTESEMIFGFPFETSDSFCDGVETLLKHGMHNVIVYPLQLFSGIDLASRERREAFGFKTKVRFAEGSFGIYADGEVIAVEKEEIVVGTKWSDFEGYLRIRRYAFFLQLLLGREFFKEFLALCSRAEVQIGPFVRHLAFADYSKHPALSSILEKHKADAQAELYDSVDELYEAFSTKLARGEKIEGVKLNLVYIAKIMSSWSAVNELLSLAETYLRNATLKESHRRIIVRYLREILVNRIVVFDRGVEKTSAFESRFDYHRWRTGDFDDLDDLLLDVPQRFTAQAHDELIDNLEEFDPVSVASLQAVVDHTAARHFLRQVTPVVPAEEVSRRSARASTSAEAPAGGMDAEA